MENNNIKKLSQDVINKIAAGEIIHRPANALKEMIENSLDAGATQISVSVKAGGIKLLQIQDNGSGIKKEDLPILCERFTTSKLKTFEDLNALTTYGFRGEALASITHVAHLKVQTMTQNSDCAFKAFYQNGKLVPEKPGQSSDPKACAGVVGTTITVDDLFYNTPTRRKVLKYPNEEYKRILNVCQEYALHNSGISFSCRKMGENLSSIHTQTGATMIENIQNLYNHEVSQEILEVECDDETLKFEMKAYVSNANYKAKKATFVLFINNRLVESSSIKKSVESVYAKVLPKGSKPWVYISLNCAPENLDVNVHPTKQEVHILNQDDIIAMMHEKISEAVVGSGSQRLFTTQSIMTDGLDLMPDNASQGSTSRMGTVFDSSSQDNSTPQKKMVRTDSRSQTLDGFISTPNDSDISTPQNFIVDDDDDYDMDQYNIDSPAKKKMAENSVLNQSSKPPKKKRRVTKRLTSISNLLSEIEKVSHAGLKQVFSDFSFVGCVDPTLALIQHGTKLFIVNVCDLSKEFCYQQVFQNFGEFNILRLAEPVSVEKLIVMALESPTSGWTEENGSREEIAEFCAKTLLEKGEMLREYLSLDIDEKGNILTLPQVIDNYVPQMEFLPMLLLRLATEVEWDVEEDCFQTLAKELSDFYCIQCVPDVENIDKLKWTVEHTIFSQIKQSEFFPPASFARDGTVVNIAKLENLYKIFERC